MKFNNKLYDLRKSNGLSQEQLAEKLNVSRQTISKWELGESTPDMEKLIMITDLFDVSMDELVLDKTTEPLESNDSFYSSFVRFKNRVFTDDNKKIFMRVLKIIAIALIALLAIDLITMIIFFIVNGVPQ